MNCWENPFLPLEVSIHSVSSAAQSVLKVLEWKSIEKTQGTAESTFSSCLPQLSILNKPCKHLRLHEDPQETANTFRRHWLAKGLPLENALSTLVLSDKQGVMADSFQEEADEGLWHQAVQRVILCRHREKEKWLITVLGTVIRPVFDLFQRNSQTVKRD